MFARIPADPILPSGMERRPKNGLGNDLGLYDRRYRPRLLPHMRACPVELRRVHRRQLDHRDGDCAVTVEKFRSQRVGEASNGVFGAAIGGLKGDASIGQRRSNLNNRSASAFPHVTQCGYLPCTTPK
jgi:hypothetical protein